MTEAETKQLLKQIAQYAWCIDWVNDKGPQRIQQLKTAFKDCHNADINEDIATLCSHGSALEAALEFTGWLFGKIDIS